MYYKNIKGVYCVASRLLVCLTLALLLCSMTLRAQTVALFGKVTGAEGGKPLQGAIVTLYSGNKLLKCVQTNAGGVFSLQAPRGIVNASLRFSLMGYAPVSVSIAEGRSNYDIQLAEQITRLKEVVVKAKGIGMKGDTISFNVGKYAGAEDKTLADVLKKLPGVEVSESGAIKFNGKAINKFYIEGKNLLDGRYGMATGNISQKDVGSVEVMENHQPIKALDKLAFSDDPAINIRLKDKARSRWAGTLKVGGGVDPSLWNVELFAMRFSKERQTLNVYKTNNTGLDCWKDMTNFSLNENPFDYRLPSFIDVGVRRLDQLDSRRSRFNRTHMVSANNLWSLGDDYDLTSSVSYLNNRLQSNSYSETTYHLADGSTNVTTEDEQAHSLQNRLNGDFILKANADKFYLQNKLNVDVQWNSSWMNTDGTYPNSQSSRIPRQQVTDSFDWIRRKGDNAFELCSTNSWQQNSQHLIVRRDSLTQRQVVRSSAFSTHTFTQLTRKFYPFSLSAKIGMEGLIRSLSSSLTGVPDTIGRTENKLSLDYFKVFFTPKLSLITPTLEVSLTIPIAYQPYFFKDKIADYTASTQLLSISPSLYLHYAFNPHLAFSVFADYKRNNLNEPSFYEGFILGDYRHISRGIVDYSTGYSGSAALCITYRNPLNAFFANLNASVQHSNQPHANNRSFLGPYIVNSFLALSNSLNFYNVNLQLSKGIDALNTTLMLKTAFQTSRSSVFQNEIKTPYTIEMWNIKATCNTRLTEWLALNYEIEGIRNVLKMTGQHTCLNELSQVLSCSITPIKSLSLQFSCEHDRNEISSSVTKSCLLADACVTWLLKKGWEVSLSAQNLFNRKQYAYRLYEGTKDFYESCSIRPRNITLNVSFGF